MSVEVLASRLVEDSVAGSFYLLSHPDPHDEDREVEIAKTLPGSNS